MMPDATVHSNARDRDLLSGDRDVRGAGDGLRLAIERRLRSGERLPQDVPLRHEGERVFVILTSGSLSISQSVVSLLRADFDAGLGLAQAPSVYHAARIVGDACGRSRRSTAPRSNGTISASTCTCCWAARSAARPPALYLIYPQGNPLQATEDSPYLQLGEVKYGRPILDRGIQAGTSLEVAAKYALLSFDATMRSNVTVGPPIDLLFYKKDSLRDDALPPARRRSIRTST